MGGAAEPGGGACCGCQEAPDLRTCGTRTWGVSGSTAAPGPACWSEACAPDHRLSSPHWPQLSSGGSAQIRTSFLERSSEAGRK